MPDGKTLGFAYANLDRAAIQRTDPTWLAKRLDDPASRFVCFIGERPAIDVSAPNVRVVQYTGKEVRDAGCQSEPVLLGIDDAGKALFAVQSEPVGDDSLVGKRLHYPDGGQVFRRIGRRRCQTILGMTRQPAHQPPISQQRQHDNGNCDQHHYR